MSLYYIVYAIPFSNQLSGFHKSTRDNKKF